MKTTDKKFIAYYRLSSKNALRGVDTSLGIESQKSQVRNYVNNIEGNLINEFIEIESGKNNDRPILAKAIAEAEKQNATLIIAKLDRLSRSVEFLFYLKSKIEKSKIKIKALDMPNFDTLTLAIYSGMAQKERESISNRVKLALQELKKEGIVLGKPENLSESAKLKGIETIKANALNNDRNRQATALITSLRSQNLSFQKIADQLNSLNFRTRNDKNFTSTSVKILWDRYCSNLSV
jgi:DNA invertase Pin-like site-specific DNA recombinase